MLLVGLQHTEGIPGWEEDRRVQRKSTCEHYMHVELSCNSTNSTRTCIIMTKGIGTCSNQYNCHHVHMPRKSMHDTTMQAERTGAVHSDEEEEVISFLPELSSPMSKVKCDMCIIISIIAMETYN